jgi:regulatory protein
VKKASIPEDPHSSDAAYSLALRWLTARELSEAQVRYRLFDRGFTGSAIDPAISRLLQEQVIDDRRAATAVARTEAKIRRHGPRRVLLRLTAMQIDRDLAREIVRDAFWDSEEEDLLEMTLERRLRGKPERLQDPAERRKLVAFLVRQGFSPSAASSALRKRMRS